MDSSTFSAFAVKHSSADNDKSNVFFMGSKFYVDEQYALLFIIYHLSFSEAHRKVALPVM